MAAPIYENTTPKDKLLEKFPDFTELQITKLLEAYFTLNWVNPSITIEKFITILKEKQHEKSKL